MSLYISSNLPISTYLVDGKPSKVIDSGRRILYLLSGSISRLRLLFLSCRNPTHSLVSGCLSLESVIEADWVAIVNLSQGHLFDVSLVTEWFMCSSHNYVPWACSLLLLSVTKWSFHEELCLGQWVLLPVAYNLMNLSVCHGHVPKVITYTSSHHLFMLCANWHNIRLPSFRIGLSGSVLYV